MLQAIDRERRPSAIEPTDLLTYLQGLKKALFFGQVTITYRDGKVSLVEEKRQFKYPEDIR